MTIKYVFTDVDLTLMGRDHVFTKENIDAINRIRELGVAFYIQTGRLTCAVDEVLDPLGINHKDDEYMICGNGAIVCDTNRHFYTDHHMKREVVLELIDYFNSVDGCVFSIVSDRMYYSSGNLISLNRNSSKIVEVVSAERMREIVNEEHIYKILVQHSDYEMMKEMAAKVGEVTNGAVAPTFSAVDNLEIINSDVSKANGMKEFCKMKNIDPAEILAIGDNFNDESMIDFAGYSACPANAVEELKKKCDYVSEYDCTQSAVADILNRMIISGE